MYKSPLSLLSKANTTSTTFCFLVIPVSCGLGENGGEKNRKNRVLAAAEKEKEDG